MGGVALPPRLSHAGADTLRWQWAASPPGSGTSMSGGWAANGLRVSWRVGSLDGESQRRLMAWVEQAGVRPAAPLVTVDRGVPSPDRRIDVVVDTVGCPEAFLQAVREHGEGAVSQLGENERLAILRDAGQ